ncbi:methylenetetrahydrofolate reductase [Rubellimicrobium sp. CFH 75288]|uniref:methylenetetrahydrofolate reductase n=1 Tax=Rubellimicrobium sp. CFH 75288 TaxID=2697034 RepID=UPI001412BE53|nr:methylenetetrahydrofolate reductase [Rubellimicrobium sp. CFH 75288]NAZ38319.1 5,10-methylenetetrahydrofolate reductase [Rubellimicrobium sp. CFH 75288]
MASVSFEFFPPRSVEASFRLWDCVQALAPLGPDFVSVTCGAGGTTREPSQEAVGAIRRRAGLRVAAHLTCAGQSRAETLALAGALADQGAEDVVALRGDLPGGGPFCPHPQGFASSVELVAALREGGRFGRIWVGAYPERHPEAQDEAADLDWLRRKLDAGATGAITQVFFAPETFLRFRDRAAAAGIAAPLVPGVLPVEDWPGARRLAARCGASIPPHVARGFDRAQERGAGRLFALAHAVALGERLLAEGVEHLHLYTLNRALMARDLCLALGLGRAGPVRAVA